MSVMLNQKYRYSLVHQALAFKSFLMLCYYLTRSPSPPVHYTAIALMSELFINWLYVSTQPVTKPCLKNRMQTAIIQKPTDNQAKISVLQGQGDQQREINSSRNSS